MPTLIKITNSKSFDYFILAARLLLGAVFISYGLAKLTDNQFGLNPDELTKPIDELSLFRISWYLFDFQPFKFFIGVSELVCGLLLIYNRTAILGALFFLPITTVILIIDITYMPGWMATKFVWRLTYYLVLDLIVLWHYREKMFIVWQAVWNNVKPKYSHSIWVYFTLPLAAIGLEIFSPRFILNFLTNPGPVFNSLGKFIDSLF